MGSITRSFGFMNFVDNVSWQPQRDWKVDVSNRSPSSERLALFDLLGNLLAFSVSTKWVTTVNVLCLFHSPRM